MNIITLTDKQYQALQNGESITIEPPKAPVLWEPKGGRFTVSATGTVHTWISEIPYKLFGTEYATQTAAEKASKAMRTHNRLLAWLSENDDGWEADWNDDNQAKYYLYKCGKSYSINLSYASKLITLAYMSEENALKLCKLLNNGIVIL